MTRHTALLIAIAVVTLLFTSGTTPGFAQCEKQKLHDTDPEYLDKFGGNVAIEGDVAVVSAKEDDTFGTNAGSVSIFRHQGADWTLDVKLIGNDTDHGDEFGAGIAIDLPRILVGATGAESDGAGYVMRWNGTSWEQEARLTADLVPDISFFGASVALQFPYAVIGNPGEVGSGGDWGSGAAHVYYSDGTDWTEVAKLTSGDDESINDYFGTVALDGNVIAVGAMGEGPDRSGAVYLFRGGESTWNLEAKLSPPEPTGDDQFGSSVDVNGDTIAVGAPWHSGAGTYSGTVYLYQFDGLNWYLTDTLVAEDTSTNDEFGYAVSLHDDTLLIGARGDASGSSRHLGSAYLYHRDADGWHEDAKLLASDGQAGDFFGCSADQDGTTAIIGAFLADYASDDTGAAYIWSLTEVAASTRSYGEGWPGTHGVPELTTTDRPLLGSSLTVRIDNSFDVATVGFLLVGFDRADFPTGRDGTLLVQPEFVTALLIPRPGLSITEMIPADGEYSGLVLDLQVLEIDLGASKGVSFTPGLELVLGDC